MMLLRNWIDKNNIISFLTRVVFVVPNLGGGGAWGWGISEYGYKFQP